MNTTAQGNEALLMDVAGDVREQKYSTNSQIEVPLQQMFDEFMVFISKADFE